MLSILVTLTIFLSASGYGLLLPLRNTREHLLIRLGVGLWLIAHLVFLAGITANLYKGVLLVILLPGIAFFLLKSLPWPLRSPSVKFRLRPPKSRIEWLILAPIVLLVILAISAALTPPTARDSLVYHLALPKLYLEHHRWLEIPENIFGYFPGLTEALYVLTMGLGSQYFALVHTALGVACLSATTLLGRAVGLRSEMRLLTVTALVATPTFWTEMTWAYVDLANTLYWTLAAVCFVRWQKDNQRYWLVLVGFFVGAASGCKYTSLILLALLPLGILLELRKSEKFDWWHTISMLTIPIMTALLTVSPWLGRNLILTGNPLYPLFWDFFPSSAPGWDAERARLYQILLAQYGGIEKNLLDYIVAPTRVFLSGQISSTLYYDGQLSFFYLLAFPKIIFKGRWHPETRTLFGLMLIYLVYWSVSSQQARFLLFILPMMAVLAGCFIQTGLPWMVAKITTNRLNRSRIEGLALSLVVVFILVNGREILNIYQKEGYLNYLLGRESTQTYLQGKLAYYKTYSYINENLPQKATIFLVKTGNHGYYLNRPYFSDAVFETYTLERFLSNSHTGTEVAWALRQRRLTHLLIRLDAFLREHGPRMREADLERFYAFLNDHCRLLMRDGPFWLFQIQAPE